MESVWDYPRPPALVPCERRVRVQVGEVTIAQSDRALRVLETASPPTVYLPPGDVERSLLRSGRGRSICEWKGLASYWDVEVEGLRIASAAWSYSRPRRRFAALKDHLAFFPGRVQCFLDAERVRPQDGDFYGGWITDDIRGPFKGAAGTLGW
jgi:uncharacterized protein (DUF427 family)